MKFVEAVTMPKVPRRVKKIAKSFGIKGIRSAPEYIIDAAKLPKEGDRRKNITQYVGYKKVMPLPGSEKSRMYFNYGERFSGLSEPKFEGAAGFDKRRAAKKVIK